MRQVLLLLFGSTWRKLSLLVVFLFVSAVYLYVFPTPTLTYVAAVLLHAGFGLLTVLFLLPKLPQIFSPKNLKEHMGWLLISLGAALGLALFFIGTSRPKWNWMYAHEALSFAGAAILAAYWAGTKGWLTKSYAARAMRYAVFLVLAAVVIVGGWNVRQGRWLSAHEIQNPLTAPLSMDGEGDGPRGPFFPSSAQTMHKGQIPSKYFMESTACVRCHKDIFNQ